MTATTQWNLDTGISLDLECERCGYTISRPGATLAGWSSVWRTARSAGWSGAGQLNGPHYCPDCVAAGSRANAPPPAAVAAGVPAR